MFRVCSVGKLGEHPPDRMPGGLERERYLDRTCLEQVKNHGDFLSLFRFIHYFLILSLKRWAVLCFGFCQDV